jgi:hypothetical protein
MAATTASFRSVKHKYGVDYEALYAFFLAAQADLCAHFSAGR